MSRAIIRNRGSTTGNTLLDAAGASDAITRELGIARLLAHSNAAQLAVANAPKQYGEFTAAIKKASGAAGAKYESDKARWTAMGYTAEESHSRALESAKANAAQDLQLVLAEYPYMADESALMNFIKPGSMAPTQALKGPSKGKK